MSNLSSMRGNKFYIHLDMYGNVDGIMATNIPPKFGFVEVNERAFTNYMHLIGISKTGSVKRNPHLVDREKPD